MLLLPHEPLKSLEDRTDHIVAGAKAYVKAAVHIVLGECESRQGPTCIVGDDRRNVRLADPSWMEAIMEDENEDKVEVTAEENDEYPDL